MLMNLSLSLTFKVGKSLRRYSARDGSPMTSQARILVSTNVPKAVGRGTYHLD